MNKKLLSLLMLISIILAVSCAKDEPETATLTLSQTSEIDFPKEASKKTITITTNQTEWLALPIGEWIETSQSGNMLTIEATENHTAETRSAKVMISAGGINKILHVRQDGTSIAMLPNKIIANQWGGTHEVGVNAESTKWSMTSTADWITVTPLPFTNKANIEIAENTKREVRKATIKLVAGKTTKEFEVEQNGIMYYILPYMNINLRPKEIRAFENERHSDIIYQASDQLTVLPETPVFSKIRYSLRKDKYMHSIEMLATSKDVLLDKEFLSFMSENNFTLTSDAAVVSERTYTLRDNTKQVDVLVTATDTKAEIVFMFTPRQSKPHTTFTEFPYSLANFTSSKDDVKKWEADNNGIYNEKLAKPDKGFLAFDVAHPWLHRTYIFEDQPTLLETSQYFPNLELSFFEREGEYFFTDEFRALMQREGFIKYVGETTTKIKFYANSKSNLWMGAGVLRFSDINNKKPILAIVLSPAPGSGSVRNMQTNQLPFAVSNMGTFVDFTSKRIMP